MTIADLLLPWYAENQRTLPWRNHPDPYAVWVSEIMLQQTRVETVIAYFRRWMSAFPSVADLAQADEREVLALWEGLGYYSRARNLHRAAKVLVDDYAGKLPETPKDLLKLPGIGRYTAAAIASMAFGKDAAALDGNIRRVYARLFDVAALLGKSETEKIFWSLANEHLPRGSAGDYNQALMDLGATICTPRNPRCDSCPLREICRSYALGNQAERPLRKKKGKTPHYRHAAAVILQGGRVLLAKRPAEGLLGGMWEFPNGRVEGDSAEGLAAVIFAGYQVQIHVREPLCTVVHAYTHFKITEDAYFCTLLESSEKENLRWVAVDDLQNFPMGKVDREIANRLS